MLLVSAVKGSILYIVPYLVLALRLSICSLNTMLPRGEMVEEWCPRDHTEKVLKLIEAGERLESEGVGVEDLRVAKECLVYSLISEEGVKAMKNLLAVLRLKAGEAVESLVKFGVITRADAQVVLSLLKHEDTTFRARIWYASNTLLEGGVLRADEMSEVVDAFLEIFEDGDTLAKYYALRIAPYLVKKGVLKPETLRNSDSVYDAVKELLMNTYEEARKDVVRATLALISENALKPNAFDGVKQLALSVFELDDMDIKALTDMIKQGIINENDKPYIIQYLKHPKEEKRAVYWVMVPLFLEHGILSEDNVRVLLDYLYDLLHINTVAWEPARYLVARGLIKPEELRAYAKHLFARINSEDDCVFLRILIDLLDDGVLTAEDFEAYKQELLSPKRLALTCEVPFVKLDVLVEKGVITETDRELVLELLGPTDCCGNAMIEDEKFTPIDLVILTNLALAWQHAPLLLERKIITPEDVKAKTPLLKMLVEKVSLQNLRLELVKTLEKLADMGVIEFDLEDLE